MHNLTEIREEKKIMIEIKVKKSKATRSSAQKYVEDDSCDNLIRIGFIHEFSSLIIKFIGFEKLKCFYQTFQAD